MNRFSISRRARATIAVALLSVLSSFAPHHQ